MTCWEPVTVIPQHWCEEDKTDLRCGTTVSVCSCQNRKSHLQLCPALPTHLFHSDRFGYFLRCRLNARTTPCSVYVLYRTARANIEYWVYKLDLNAPWMPHPLSNSNLLSLESRPWMLSQTLFTYFLIRQFAPDLNQNCIKAKFLYSYLCMNLCFLKEKLCIKTVLLSVMNLVLSWH